MSVLVLLDLLNELRKSDKMRGLLSILSRFRNRFNKLNNTGARILDSTYHMTLKYFCNRVFGVFLLCISFYNVLCPRKSVNYWWCIDCNA